MANKNDTAQSEEENVSRMSIMQNDSNSKIERAVIKLEASVNDVRKTLFNLEAMLKKISSKGLLGLSARRKGVREWEDELKNLQGLFKIEYSKAQENLLSATSLVAQEESGMQSLGLKKEINPGFKQRIATAQTELANMNSRFPFLSSQINKKLNEFNAFGRVGQAVRSNVRRYVIILLLLFSCIVIPIVLIFSVTQQSDAITIDKFFELAGTAYRIKSCAGGELTQDCAKDLKSFMNDEMEKGYTSLPENKESI